MKSVLNSPGDGAVLVVDGGGSLETALMGDMIAAAAVTNGWSGVIINGAIRDRAALAQLPLGVKALGSNPRKSARREPAAKRTCPSRSGEWCSGPAPRSTPTWTASWWTSSRRGRRANVRGMELRLEVVQVPVSDLERQKTLYREWLALDHDVEHIPGMRVVQLTPPGSATSIVIGTGMTSMQPGSLEGLQLVVPDMESARSELVRRGADISAPQDLGGFLFAYFGDPDGNRWVIQEIRPNGAASSAS